jgi:type II secretory pathway pseudopilin PulG
MNRHRKPRPWRAVTLVEVMVVTSIIMVLAALTFTIVRAAMEAAKKGACINNLKQQFAAIKLYEEAVGFYPVRWSDLVAQVPSVRTSLVCPKDDTKGYGTNPDFDGGRSTPRFGPDSDTPPHSYNTTLTYAWWLANGKPEDVPLGPTKPAAFSDPTMPIVWCDWHVRTKTSKGPLPTTSFALTLFNDGHVAWRRSSAEDLKQWYPD